MKRELADAVFATEIFDPGTNVFGRDEAVIDRDVNITDEQWLNPWPGHMGCRHSRC